MPWKECHVMDERVRFVARLLDGQKMAVLCEEFGLSRKTGYKIYQRYEEIGAKGLTDRSRRPHRHANQLPTLVEKAIVRLEKDYPSWGAPKIRERLKQKLPDVACPAISTVYAVPDRHGLVKRRQCAFGALGFLRAPFHVRAGLEPGDPLEVYCLLSVPSLMRNCTRRVCSCLFRRSANSPNVREAFRRSSISASICRRASWQSLS